MSLRHVKRRQKKRRSRWEAFWWNCLRALTRNPQKYREGVLSLMKTLNNLAGETDERWILESILDVLNDVLLAGVRRGRVGLDEWIME